VTTLSSAIAETTKVSSPVAYPLFSADHYRLHKVVPGPPFPKTLCEFDSKFASEEACQQYLAACRWPDGFVGPRCGDRQSAGCPRFLTAGTILQNIQNAADGLVLGVSGTKRGAISAGPMWARPQVLVLMLVCVWVHFPPFDLLCSSRSAYKTL
jgi:Transposase zinc-ribbon domain